MGTETEETILLTKDLAAAAFTRWQEDYIANKSHYTPVEEAGSSYGEQCATHLFDLVEVIASGK